MRPRPSIPLGPLLLALACAPKAPDPRTDDAAESADDTDEGSDEDTDSDDATDEDDDLPPCE